MSAGKKLSIETKGECELEMRRDFAAPRSLVFRAFTEPDLLRRWLGVFRGWSLETCQVDLRVGGGIRYEWKHVDGRSMGMRSEIRELIVPERIVSTEVFDEPWYPGEAVGTLILTQKGSVTTMVNTIRYASKEARDGVLKSGMDQGLSVGYDQLDTVLADSSSPGRNVGRSVLAIVVGFLSVALVSLGIDQLLHVARIYPPWGQPMYQPELNALALSYRVLLAIIGSFVAAHLAPRFPMWHAMFLGAVGFALSTLGGIAAMGANLGPAWYPILLALSALPCAWVGGRLHQAWHA